jgi:hypothetical protein
MSGDMSHPHVEPEYVDEHTAGAEISSDMPGRRCCIEMSQRLEPRVAETRRPACYDRHDSERPKR